MAGLYFHIPFCKQACTYCDFHFSTNRSNEDEMISAMVKELELRSSDWKTQHFETIYFGGGSPSILNKGQLHRLLEAAYKHLRVDSNAEISMEANPDDMSKDKLQEWRTLGISRLSVGLQSFQNKRLTWMNRAHNTEEALACVKRAQDIGFNNISIDLIYGLPTSTLEEWREELAIAKSMNVQHFSAYILTVEERTALHHQVKKGSVKPAPDEMVEAQYNYLCSWAKENGFEHYEISNFAQKGCRSKHNGNYWNWVDYLGVGPAAHSFHNKQRSWNIAHNINYIKKLSEAVLPAHGEALSKADEFNETIMLGLRKTEGINVALLNSNYIAFLGEDALLSKERLSDRHLAMLSIEDGIWKMKELDWLLCDEVSAALFYSA